MHEINLNDYNLRSDLVVDSINYISKNKIKEYKYKDIKVTVVELIKNNNLNKNEGKYITISFNDITDQDNSKNVLKVFKDNLKELVRLKGNDKILIIGLGNILSTPDSLGPKVTNKILVTRYLFENKTINIEQGFSNVSILNPGVSGITGIESFEVIESVIKKIKPDLVIAIDALASTSIDRINKTIQMTNTGISPGSGVGNNKKELSYKTLKIPVIAIGVPTVIDSLTIVTDTINLIDKNIDKENLKLILDKNIKNNLMVTIKEIDFIIDKLSDIISTGLNKYLHKNYKKLN